MIPDNVRIFSGLKEVDHHCHQVWADVFAGIRVWKRDGETRHGETWLTNRASAGWSRPRGPKETWQLNVAWCPRWGSQDREKTSGDIWINRNTLMNTLMNNIAYALLCLRKKESFSRNLTANNSFQKEECNLGTFLKFSKPRFPPPTLGIIMPWVGPLPKIYGQFLIHSDNSI